jgi:hypothetical protein
MLLVIARYGQANKTQVFGFGYSIKFTESAYDDTSDVVPDPKTHW